MIARLFKFPTRRQAIAPYQVLPLAEPVPKIAVFFTVLENKDPRLGGFHLRYEAGDGIHLISMENDSFTSRIHAGFSVVPSAEDIRGRAGAWSLLMHTKLANADHVRLASPGGLVTPIPDDRPPYGFQAVVTMAGSDDRQALIRYMEREFLGQDAGERLEDGDVLTPSPHPGKRRSPPPQGISPWKVVKYAAAMVALLVISKGLLSWVTTPAGNTGWLASQPPVARSVLAEPAVRIPAKADSPQVDPPQVDPVPVPPGQTAPSPAGYASDFGLTPQE